MSEPINLKPSELIEMLALAYNAGIDAALSPNRMPPVHDFPYEARGDWFAKWLRGRDDAQQP